ncbi:MAG: DUF4166 domain-containing protein [Pseudomonadota bacterium]
MNSEKKLFFARTFLFFAAVYNVAWGLLFALFPHLMLFDSTATPYLLILIQCIAMLVGAYGLAYLYASQDPARYWPLVLVGLIGKVLGPIGTLVSIANGVLTTEFFIKINITNDVIWLAPFAWILIEVHRSGFEQPAEDSLSLYQRILGSNFENLGPALKRFHSSLEPTKASGLFQVQRGSNLMTRALGAPSRLPPSGQNVPVTLAVNPTNGSESWDRQIGNCHILTQQSLFGSTIVEQYGAIRFYLRASVESGNLIIKSKSATFLGLPCPPFLTPWVWAKAVDQIDNFDVEVKVGCFPFGSIVEYKGTVEQNSTQPADPKTN